MNLALIFDRVFVNYNCIFHDNYRITIGKNSIIGAESVVTKDIPASVIAVGNPCKVIREIRESDKLLH